MAARNGPKAHRRLVLIGGPIASGKTTAAQRLARAARERGEPAAAIDMDMLVEMAGGEDWSFIGAEERELACDLAAGLISRLFEHGVSFVAVAGSTLSAYEWDGLLRHLQTEAEVICVLLRVSLAESVRRAQADPSRVATHDPEFVERIYRTIDWDDVPSPDIEVVTDYLSKEQVVEAIERAVLAPA